MSTAIWSVLSREKLSLYQDTLSGERRNFAVTAKRFAADYEHFTALSAVRFPDGKPQFRPIAGRRRR